MVRKYQASDLACDVASDPEKMSQFARYAGQALFLPPQHLRTQYQP